MHIHILGICGTFMGSLAQLAKALGHRVTGSDANVYPPMSTQLEQAGIELTQGYDPAQLEPQPDLVVIGNAMSRGNPSVEYVLDRGLSYTSGPQWLAQHLLHDKWVLAISGTHGKTTTSSMVAWLLEYAGMSPGFLIGGVPKNFDVSARLGETPFFVVEADEYDSAFFDKRSKFVHYQPRTLVMNNLEFDHADIFPDLAAIQRQFHHLVRTVPSNGAVIYPADYPAIDEVLQQGCWTPQQTMAFNSDQGDWSAIPCKKDASEFSVYFKSCLQGRVIWSHTGQHNMANGLAAIVAAHHVGVTIKDAIAGLSEFEGVKRRMECLAQSQHVHIYDDFAHHPTAIETTLQGLRASVGQEKIIALIEPRSNTMRMGSHREKLNQVIEKADAVLWYQPPGLAWDLDAVVRQSSVPAKVLHSTQDMVDATAALIDGPSHVVVMSNGGFGGIHQMLVQQLIEK